MTETDYVQAGVLCIECGWRDGGGPRVMRLEEIKGRLVPAAEHHVETFPTHDAVVLATPIAARFTGVEKV